VNANLAESRVMSVPSAVADEPLYFPPETGRLFGWLHQSVGHSTSDVGLVICKPFGYETLCAHRSLRAFADAAASSGVPTLSFDYSTTGDSADSDLDADQIATWCEDVIAAVTELRRRTGVRRVCLLAFRLGTVLARLAADRTTVDALILVAPIINGRLYLRELQTTQSIAARARASSNGKRGAGDGAATGDRSMEIGGYRLSAQTISNLEQVDLAALGAPPVPALLVIDRSGQPAARAWANSLGGPGIKVDYAALPGFVEMMMTPPQYGRVPHAMIDFVSEWLEGFAARTPAAVAADPRREAWETTSLSLPGQDPLADVMEHPVRFGPDAILFGILTEPRRAEARRRAVILLNAGSDSHVSIARMYVDFARRWAQHGYRVLRMDLAGLGDSGTRAGRPDNEVFPPAAVEDVRLAIDFLRDKYGVHEVTVGGLCTGAYHALRAAVAGLPMSQVLMVNPQNFYWEEGTSITDLQPVEVVRNPGLYGERVFSLTAWKRVLTGRVNIWRIARIYVHRMRITIESVVRDAARRLHVPLPRDLGRDLQQVAERGVQMVFVFARGEAGLELLRLQSGSALMRLGDGCRVHIIEDTDHNFTQSGPRMRLEAVLREELSRRPTEYAPCATSPVGA
jgi:alpha-beta hydrolase superfamily lysophospholipase